MTDNQHLRRIKPEDIVIVMEKDADENDRQRIQNGPVYHLEVVKQEVAIEGKRGIKFVTDSALTDQFKLTMGPLKLPPFIRALEHDPHFRKSERCGTTIGMVADCPGELDCDAYAMDWDRKKQVEDTEFGLNTYLKFGFSDVLPDCLVVSIHGKK